ncbi:hypothetical protein BsWGS_10327 [Bradybaena similaris]
MYDTIFQSGPSTYIILSVLFALTGYALFLWLFNKTVKNLPPGPRDWATTWKMIKATKQQTMHELATEWARQYGPLTYTTYLGQKMLYLNNADVTRRLLASDDSKFLVADRTIITPAKVAAYGGKDLVFSSYDAIMKKKRRLFHNCLHLYGDGIQKFEDVVAGEMDRLMDELEQYENQDVEFWKHIARSLKVIIYILALGERPADLSTPDILEEYDIAFNKIWTPEYDIALTNLPFLANIPGVFKNAVDRLKTARTLAEELIYYAPKRSWIPGQPRGITDLLFDMQGKPGNEWMQKDPQHTIAFLMSLFWSAHLTSRASLLGIFLCLVNYPAVTKKLQEEIDHVLGDRRPKLEDRSNMPYMEATIIETLRLISQVPMCGLRTSTEEFTFEGMTIPKDTRVLINNWFFHHNEDTFEDPWTFKPERFIDNHGELLPPDHPLRKNLLPFGVGLRSCPGEIFARSRVFMFVTMILQKYDVLPPVNEKLVPADFRVNHEQSRGFIRQAPPYKCRLQRRKTAHK